MRARRTGRHRAPCLTGRLTIRLSSRHGQSTPFRAAQQLLFWYCFCTANETLVGIERVHRCLCTILSCRYMSLQLQCMQAQVAVPLIADTNHSPNPSAPCCAPFFLGACAPSCTKVRSMQPIAGRISTALPVGAGIELMSPTLRGTTRTHPQRCVPGQHMDRKRRWQAGRRARRRSESCCCHTRVGTLATTMSTRRR